MQIKKLINTGTLFLLTVLGLMLSIRENTTLSYLTVPLIFIGIFSFTKPQMILFGVFAAYYGKLLIPGMPSALGVYQIFCLGTVAWSLAGKALARTKVSRTRSGIFTAIFIAVVIMHMIFRGFGMRVLGGTEYGGAAYISLLLTLLLYHHAPSIRLEYRDVRVLYWVIALASAIPALVQLSLVWSGGATEGLLQYVRVPVQYIAQAALTGERGSARWSEFAQCGIALMIIALTSMYGRRPLLMGLVLVVAVFLVALSGFRNRILAISVITISYMVFMSQKRLRTAFMLIGILAVAYLFMASTASFWPRPVQRVLSMLPLVNVEFGIAKQAEESALYRMDIWRMCWENQGKYWIVGRGLVTDVAPMAYATMRYYGGPEFLYLMHGYHSGPFSLLHDFGVFGLISMTAFFILAGREGWQGVRKFKAYKKDPMVRFYILTAVMFTYYAWSYYLINGDVIETLPRSILLAITLRCCRSSLEEKYGQGAHASAIALPAAGHP